MNADDVARQLAQASRHATQGQSFVVTELETKDVAAACVLELGRGDPALAGLACRRANSGEPQSGIFRVRFFPTHGTGSLRRAYDFWWDYGWIDERLAVVFVLPVVGVPFFTVGVGPLFQFDLPFGGRRILKLARDMTWKAAIDDDPDVLRSHAEFPVPVSPTDFVSLDISPAAGFQIDRLMARMRDGRYLYCRRNDGSLDGGVSEADIGQQLRAASIASADEQLHWDYDNGVFSSRRGYTCVVTPSR